MLRGVPLAALLAFSAFAFAAPAPWHWWKSRLDGRLYCAQTSPGSGWTRVAGPFDNMQCRKRENGEKPGRTRPSKEMQAG